LALDGVNPFGDLSSCHYTWLVVLLNYNLPPWLVMKRYVLMLALIIHDKEFATSGNVDVYLDPLIEKLQMLCKGVSTFDAHQRVTFSLKSGISVIFRMCDQGFGRMPTLWPIK